MVRSIRIVSLGIAIVLFVSLANAQPARKFRLKLSEEAAAKLQKKELKKDAKGNVLTSISALDQMNAKTGAVEMKRVFPHGGKYEARHRKHGLHLWYELTTTKKDINLNSIVKEYSQLSEVQIAEEVREKVLIDAFKGSQKIAATSNDNLFSTQWHYHNTGQSGGTSGADISLLNAWDIETGNSDVVVAIIDGGSDPNHDDLQETTWINEAESQGSTGVDDDGNGYVDDIYGYNFAYATGTIEPHYHGVHVAGTVAAVNNNGTGVAGVAGGSGVGDGVRLMNCQVFAEWGSGGFDVAFVYAADNGAVISQNSWGYTSPGFYEQSVLDAIDYFIENAGYDAEGNPVGPMQGGLVIFAAGNSSSSADYYPGYYDKVLSVAATDHNDQIASFSNYGTWVDISAPGDNVFSTFLNNTYEYLSGTSMACPHVSGAAALIVSRFPGITPDGVWQRLTTFADNIDAQNPSYLGMMGSGRLNALNSLQEEDSIPPAAIADLSFENVSFDKVTLTWTATGASDTTGTASGYIVKFSTSNITEDNFNDASTYPTSKTPNSAGSAESLQVSGLSGLTTYYFAIKASDFSGNRSSISNVISITTTGPPELAVSPQSVIHNMFSGKRDTLQLSISNQGEGLLEAYAEVELSTSPTSAISLNSKEGFVEVSNPDNKSVSKVKITPFSYEGPSLAGIKIATNVGTYDYFTDQLIARGAEIEYYYALEYLPWDDVQIVFLDDNNMYEIDAAVAASIREFVAAGNSLFIMADDYSSVTPIIQLLDGTGITCSSVDYADAIITNFEQHPSTQDVERIGSYSYGLYYHSPDSSKILMYDDYGRPHAVAAQFGSGKIVAFGNEVAADPFSEDNGLYLHQTIDWLSDLVQWISVSENSLQLQNGETTEIPIFLDTENLLGGQYLAEISIFSNDPQQPEAVVPIELTVTGSPSIDVSVDSLRFTDVFITAESSQSFVVSNTGTDDLILDFDFATDTIFSLSNSQAVIGPKSSQSFMLSFKPQADSLYERLLTIHSNDPEDSVIIVQIRGNGVYPPEMQIAPDSIAEVIYYNGKATVNITVDNSTGGSPLYFTVSKDKEYQDIETLISNVQNSFSTSSGYKQKTVVKGQVQEFSVNSKEDVASFKPNLSSVGKDVLILTDYYYYAQNIINFLTETNRFKSISHIDINYYIPTLTELLEFDVVLIHSPGYNDPTTLGNNLADFVDAGGGVVSTLFENASSGNRLTGRWDSEAYRVFEWSYHQYNYYLSLAPVNANHYLLSDVDSFEGGYYSVSPSTQELTDGSHLVATWSNGLPLIAYKTINQTNRVDLGFFPVSSDYAWDFWNSSTDGDIIIANALDFAGRANAWIQPVDSAGTIQAGDSKVLDVVLNAEKMDPGTYSGKIYIHSNDPANPLDSVHLALEVIAAPDINTEHPQIVFDTTFVGYSSESFVVISNEGTDTLYVEDVVVADSSFSVEPSMFALAPGETDSVYINFEPELELDYNTTISFLSNDPDEDTLLIHLSAVALDPPVIEHAPDQFAQTLPTGYLDTLYVTIANAGGSDLKASFSFVDSTFVEAEVEETINRINASSDKRLSRKDAQNVAGHVVKEPGAYNEIAGTRGTTTSGLNVAVLGASTEEALTDVVNKLYSTGQFASVSYLNVQYFTPTINDISVFDAVLVFNHYSYDDPYTLGNVLADYMDNGGGVVTAMFELSDWNPLSGRWDSDQYYLVERSWHLDSHVDFTNHGGSLLEGVDTFDGGVYCYRPGGSVVEGADVVAHWDDGAPLIVTKNIDGHQRVDLGFFPVSSDVFWDCWDSSTDGATIMANALLYSIGSYGSWVSFPSASVSIPEGSSVQVPIVINSERKPAGTYYGNIVLSSNDPVTPTSIIPITLDVTPASDIDITKETIVFDTLFRDIQQQVVDLKIENIGSAPLTIDLVLSDSTNFHVEPNDVTIAPFSDSTVQVSFRPAVVGQLDESLTILSNDPKEPVIEIPLSGFSLDRPIMTVSADSIEISVDAGNYTYAEITIGNEMGLSDLKWNAYISYPSTFANVNDSRFTKVDESLQKITDKKAASALRTYLDQLATVTADTLQQPGWLYLDSYTGTIGSGETQNVGLSFDAYNLLHGVYRADLSIVSNDPLNNYDVVPVWLNVIGRSEIIMYDTAFTFEPEFIGASDTVYAFFYNDGTKELEVAVENTVEAHYSASLYGNPVAPGQWGVVEIVFSPTATGQLDGDLIVHTNDETNSTISVSVSGVGLEAPVAVFEPEQMSVYVQTGTTQINTFTIQNTGGNDLTVKIPEFIQPSSYMPNGFGGGGESALGYEWIDSNEPHGPQFNWIDITSTGTPIYLSDDSYTGVSLPFEFSFFGQPKNYVYISSNGYITFSEYGANFTSPSLLSGYPYDVISALGSDLYPNGGDIFYYGDTEKFVVSYISINNFGGGGYHTFQIILYRSGKIKLQYLDTEGSAWGQVGIEDADGLKGFIINEGVGYVTDMLAIDIFNAQDFVSGISPAEVTISPGTTQTFHVSLDATELDSGSYTRNITLLTNDPLRSVVAYEINMEVVDLPVFTSALHDTVVVGEGSSLDFQFETTNPRNAALNFSLQDSVHNASITIGGRFIFSPDYEQEGFYPFEVRVNDGFLENAHTFWIQVVNTNRPPHVSAPISLMRGRVGETLTIKGNDIFLDDDLEPLTYHAISDDTVIALPSVNEAGEIELALFNSGIAAITLTATDGIGASVSELFAIEVYENHAPHIFKSIPDQIVTLREPSLDLDLSHYITDLDGDSLHFSFSSSSNEIDAELSNDVFTFVATKRESIEVHVTATDGLSEVTTSFMIEVKNLAPEFIDTLQNVVTFLTADTIRLDIEPMLSDFELDPLSLEVEVEDPSLIFAKVTEGMLSLRILERGATSVSVKANDSFGGAVEAEFTVTIVNREPTLSALGGELSEITTSLSEQTISLSLDQYFGDPDDDALSYTASSSAQDIITTAINSNMLVMNLLDDGQSEISVQAIDPFGGAITMTFNATVAPVTSAETRQEAALFNVFPNPANQQVTITYSVDKRSQVNIALLDSQGKVIENILSKVEAEGDKKVEYQSKLDIHGFFILMVQVGNTIDVEKIFFE